VNGRPETMALLAALRFDYDALRHELNLLNDIELVVLRGASTDLQLDIAVLLQERARRDAEMNVVGKPSPGERRAAS
jgi:hypothetical protein